MKVVGVREFRRYLRKHLKDLPVAISIHGQTRAIVVGSDFFDFLVDSSSFPSVSAKEGEKNGG